MDPDKISEDQIVDLVLGRGLPSPGERVREAMLSDPDVAALHSEWTDILATLPAERKAQQAMRHRAMGRVMRRLPEARTRQSESEPWALHRSWKGLCIGLAATAFVVVLAGYVAVRSGQPPSEYVRVHQTTVPSEHAASAVRYVEFQSAGRELGTEACPYGTLDRVIASADTDVIVKIRRGSTGETPRIAKPMTLVAVAGPVRIGVE